jgi:hypothetical protein
MQIPPHRSLLLHNCRRVDAEASKYSRTEFGDRNPSWLLAGESNRGHARDMRGPKKAAPELPKPALVRGGLGAEH